MKVNVVIDSISRAAGGLFDAERRLCQCLNEAGVTISAFSLADDFSAQDAGDWLPIVPESYAAGWPAALGRSSRLRARLLAEPADLLYRAGLWKWPSRYALEWSRQHKKPEIIAPHGMLDPWAVKNSAWKKRLALLLYEREHLGRAACIRALCEAEARAIRAFGLKNPICIIPNGIDLPDLSEAQSAERKAEHAKSKGQSAESGEVSGQWSVVSSQKARGNEFQLSGFSVSDFAHGRKVLLYLGRIHPKKGLVNLLRAWRKEQSVDGKAEEWLLAIAGWDQGGHESELKLLCDELGIAWQDAREHSTSNIQRSTLSGKAESGKRKADFNLSAFQNVSVLFLGPQFGGEKAACYRNCDAFILPSFSEGLPMVVLEAWAYGKPVLMTPECNLPEGFAANAAIRMEPSAESIALGLRELFCAAQSAGTSPLRLERYPSLAGAGEGGRRPGEGRWGETIQCGEGQGEVSNLTSCSELSAMGMRGRQLVASRFAWPKIAAEMKSVYEWVLGGGAKPGCVV